MTNTLQAAQHNTNFSVAPDVFEGVIRNLDDAHADLLRWWYFLGKDRNWSLGQLAKAAGVSSTTLSRVFRGKYEAALDSVLAALGKAKANFAEQIDNPDFIATSLAKRFFRVCDRCRALATVAILWGPMGIGKTTIAEEYKRQNNHGRTAYMRCGAGLTFAAFISLMARSLGITAANQNQYYLREKIVGVLNAGQRLLIVDELHQIFLTTRGDTAVRICEFLREVFDRSKCGMVLLGTDVVQYEFFKGQHRDALAQLVDRGTIQMPLPAKPTKGDIAAFLKHYNLPMPGADEPEAAELLRDIVASAGLRKLTLHLRDGAANAARLNEPFNWGHFVEAHDDLKSLAA